jgi:hypothetical protein
VFILMPRVAVMSGDFAQQHRLHTLHAAIPPRNVHPDNLAKYRTDAWVFDISADNRAEDMRFADAHDSF